jgi:hypothetical protein
MEMFTYEAAKYTVVITAYCLIWILAIWWYGYIIVSLGQLIWHGIKKSIAKIRKRKRQLAKEEENM